MIILGLYGAFDWEANKSFNEYENPTWCHDSGATLFIDGKHICSISEERLTRVKHEGNFPVNSINYCLNEGNITNEDVNIVSIPSMCIDIFYKQLYERRINKKISELFPNAKIELVSHHLSHAASSVFSSDIDEGSFLTLDNAGSLLYNHNFNYVNMVENSSLGYFNKKKNIFKFFNGIPNTNNFGEFYHYYSYSIYCEKVKKQISAYDEKYRETYDGKIMGLSAYGSNTELTQENKLYKTSKELFYEDVPYVSFILDSSQTHFKFKSTDEKAYTLQKNFESALLEYLIDLKNKTYLENNVCFAGGCFLNVLGNSVIKFSNLFEKVHIPPFTSDMGLHFGAVCFTLFKNKQTIELPENIALLGKTYHNNEIEATLKDNDISYKKFENFEELCEEVAIYLNENKIIGWFQNRSEFGPRALGSRSLLMHPGPAENKDIMNSRVKHREYWRPFAGIILEEYLNDYFYEDFVSPYMLYSLTVKENKVNEISAITHRDKTCRIQTVNEKLNPEINLLLEKFDKISGIPVVLNTSFNDNGEPIVETPQDAINSFKNMDIDYLVIGNFLLEK
jgi:carbamoyltransferase